MYFQNYRLQEKLLDKCLKSLILKDTSTSHMVNGPNTGEIFTAAFIFICEINWVMCKILGMLVNTLTDNDKYYLLSRHNLTQQIQMQFPQKNFFFFIFFCIFEICINFWIFLKRRWLS